MDRLPPDVFVTIMVNSTSELLRMVYLYSRISLVYGNRLRERPRNPPDPLKMWMCKEDMVSLKTPKLDRHSAGYCKPHPLRLVSKGLTSKVDEVWTTYSLLMIPYLWLTSWFYVAGDLYTLGVPEFYFEAFLMDRYLRRTTHPYPSGLMEYIVRRCRNCYHSVPSWNDRGCDIAYAYNINGRTVCQLTRLLVLCYHQDDTVEASGNGVEMNNVMIHHLRSCSNCPVMIQTMTDIGYCPVIIKTTLKVARILEINT